MLSVQRASTEQASAVERLSEHAALLEAWLNRPARLPARWRTGLFARSVDLVRSHLRPIVTQDLLAMSYGQEHFHVIAVADPSASPTLLSRNATEVAYAMRWLELGQGTVFGPWTRILDGGDESDPEC